MRMVNNMIRVVITFKRNDIEFNSVFAFETLDLALSFVNDIAACTVTEIEEFTIYTTKERKALEDLLRKHRNERR